MAVKKLCGACGQDALERNPNCAACGNRHARWCRAGDPRGIPTPRKTSAPPAGNPPTKPTPTAKPASNANRGALKQKAANPGFPS